MMKFVEPTQVRPSADTDRHLGPPTADEMRPALNVRRGVEDGDDVPLGHVHRPTWRGRIHVIALVAVVPAFAALLLNSTGDTRLRFALGVYAVGMCTMFAASATYHRWVHGLRARATWRRVDHAAIFAAIAGSSTPIVLAALPGTTGLVLVAAVWFVALLAAGLKLSRWSGGDRAGTAMYAVIGVLDAAALPWLLTRHGIAPTALVVAGGIVYLVGAAGLARRWPTLRPGVFSYHEVWHVFTIVAAVTQFGAIWMLAT